MFRHEIFALLGCYVAQVRNYLPTFRGQPIGPIFKRQAFQEDGTRMLSRNVRK